MTSKIVPELDCILTVRDPGTFHISGSSSRSRNNLNMALKNANDAGANALSRDAYVKLLSTGEGLSKTNMDATKKAWAGISMIDPCSYIPREGEITDVPPRRSCPWNQR